MRAVAKIDETQIASMSLDITFRMKVTEWQSLLRNMDVAQWPSCAVVRHIQAVLSHVEKSTAKTFTDPLHEVDRE